MKLAILSVAAFAFWACPALASDGVTYPPECMNGTEVICARLAANSTGILQANGYCAQLTNSSPNDYFIPLNTGTERNSFVTNALGIGVTVAACCMSPHCMPTP